MLSLLNSCLSKVAAGRPHSASRYIMEDVFVFPPPRPLSCCVFLAKMVSRPVDISFVAEFCRWNASSHVVSLPRTQARFSGSFSCMCVHVCAVHTVHNMCASHLPGHIGVRLTKSGLDGYSQMNASPSIGSQASNMNVQKRHWPFYTVYQMKRRFIFRSPISSICTPESSYPDAQGGHHWQKNLPPFDLTSDFFVDLLIGI